MRLYERAAYRRDSRRPLKKLAESPYSRHSASWYPDEGYVRIVMVGFEGASKPGTTYRYEVELTLEELGHLFDVALAKFPKKSLRTLVQGVTRSFREAGRPRKKRPKSGA